MPVLEPVIYCDTRGMGTGILQLLGAAGVDSLLDAGDWAFWGKDPVQGGPIYVGVEGKKMRALLADIKSHRAMAQVEKMLKIPDRNGQVEGIYDRAWLLVEENLPYRVTEDGFLSFVQGRDRNGQVIWEDTRFLFSAYDNFLSGLQERGVRFKVAHGQGEAARELLNLYSYYQKDPDEHDSTGAEYKPFTWDGRPTLRRKVASQLTGIGFKRSRDVEAVFSTTYEMVMAGVEEWMQAKGIGRPSAERIVKEIREG